MGMVSAGVRGEVGETVGKSQPIAKTGLRKRKAKATCLGFLVLTQSTPLLDALALSGGDRI